MTGLTTVGISHLYYVLLPQWYRITMSVSDPHETGQTCSLARRLGAMTYDALALVAIWMVATAIIVIGSNKGIDSGNLLFQLYLLGLAFLYFHASWTRIGQTLGMRTWRIRLDPGPQPFGLSRSLLRFLAGLLSLALLGLGFFWALGRSDRRGWPDLASRSRLVYSGPRKH